MQAGSGDDHVVFLRVVISELAGALGTPDICPFKYNTTLFRFVKNTPNLRKFAKNSKTGQNYALSMLKCTFALKKYTTAGCVVVTNMSYALDLFLT